MSVLFFFYLQNLRDPQGNLYSPSEYNLQQSADGGVHLLRRENVNRNTNQMNVQMQQGQPQQPNQQQQQQNNSTHHISHHHHNPHH